MCFTAEVVAGCGSKRKSDAAVSSSGKVAKVPKIREKKVYRKYARQWYWVGEGPLGEMERIKGQIKIACSIPQSNVVLFFRDKDAQPEGRSRRQSKKKQQDLDGGGGGSPRRQVEGEGERPLEVLEEFHRMVGVFKTKAEMNAVLKTAFDKLCVQSEETEDEMARKLQHKLHLALPQVFSG